MYCPVVQCVVLPKSAVQDSLAPYIFQYCTTAQRRKTKKVDSGSPPAVLPTSYRRHRGDALPARLRCPVAAWAAVWLCVASTFPLAADATNVAGLVSLLLPSSDGEVDAAACPDLYRRYSRRHTQCVRPPKSCHPLHEGVSEADRQLILDEHNAFRNRLASGAEAASGLPAAANMMYLEWNDELATVAQKLASMCAIKPDCADCRRVESFMVGQNICNYKIRTQTAPPIYWRSTIAYWYNGVKQFPPAAISPYVYRQYYGTFSQARHLLINAPITCHLICDNVYNGFISFKVPFETMAVGERQRTPVTSDSSSTRASPA
ncbi:uncharacterized protein LOC142786768 [Rhipicephalus microplus]|uniref:uncharacterized protein LOC142786768 n=1 Tax=Rhipicephalus microplus TaxID=6941 RepID=UPI003F6C6D58